MSARPRDARAEPLPPERLRARLRSSRVVTNAWVSGDSGYLAEVLAHAGFDSVTIDLQHGMFGLDGALRLLQAVDSAPATAMARVPSPDAALIGKLLDGGAWGIICPNVDDAETCARFVGACRYPPVGRRSYGPARALLVGGSQYPSIADDLVMTWAMIESADALGRLDEILTVDGLDGVYVGPNDLAMSLGRSVEPGLDARVRDHLQDVATAAHAAGRFAGVFAPTPEVAGWLAEVGFDLVTPGNDAGLLRDAAARRIAAVRGGAERRTAR